MKEHICIPLTAEYIFSTLLFLLAAVVCLEVGGPWY
jgi:hypothetical protein